MANGHIVSTDSSAIGNIGGGGIRYIIFKKEATKPTYTASEVGALASNGTAVNASKVNNALTVSLNGTSQGAYDGSAVKNPPCSAGDADLIPGWGTKIPQATGATEPTHHNY